MLQNLCTPALIYLIFSITQITIDIFRKDYNIALVKFTVAFIFTILLNYLCSSGLGIVSWIIVFIPFILMSVIVSYILTFFGIDPKTKKIRILQNGEELKRDTDKKEIDKNSPVLSNISVNYSEGENKIIINYTSNEEGKVWCKAIKKSDNKVPTIIEMKEEQSQDMSIGDDNTCKISDYVNDKEYDVYMYAEDKLSNGMNNQQMLSTKKSIVTTSSTNNSDGSTPTSTSTSGTSGVSGFQNISSGYSNFFNNNSKLYKERKQHIDHINKILLNLNENDNSSYFLIQAETCANKKTNQQYELCMKRLLQEIHSRIKITENKIKFLALLEKTKINITGIKEKLI